MYICMWIEWITFANICNWKQTKVTCQWIGRNPPSSGCYKMDWPLRPSLTIPSLLPPPKTCVLHIVYIKNKIAKCCSPFRLHSIMYVWVWKYEWVKWTSSQSSVDAITKIALEHNRNSNIVRTAGRASNQGHQTHQGVHFVRFSLRSVPVSRQSLMMTYFNIRFSTPSKANGKVKFHKYK